MKTLSAKELKSFEKYAAELTVIEIERCHFEANTINSKMKLRSIANNKERNILTRLENAEIKNVVERSKATTKSDKLNRALTEFRTLHAHVKHVNDAKLEYYDKRTQTFETISIDMSYLKRHIKHNTEKLSHLFKLETQENKIRVIERTEDVSAFKTA